MSRELGRLERVDPRNAWTSEAADFTPWLAQAHNLELLGEAIGIELELEAQERSVGPFRADILCKNTATDDWVLIENQLARTDHTHLGQLITYAAGLEAVTIVWIAAPFTEQHRAALDWLNNITDSRFNFFGLEVELWQIGGSPFAPKFNIVSKPNDWSKTVHEGVRVINDELTEAKRLQLDFWTHFNNFVSSRRSVIKPIKPRPQNWMFLGIGQTGFKLIAIASTWNTELASYETGEIRAELGLYDPEKRDFEFLQGKRTEIESKLGYPVDWYNDPHKQSSKIFVRKSVDFRDRNDWDNQCAWLLKHLEDFHRVLGPFVKQFRDSNLLAAAPNGTTEELPSDLT
jgi:hypothetical protein